MLSAAAVLVCTLYVLGSSEATFPPIAFVDTAPPEVSRSAEAFVGRNPDAIVLITSSPAFQAARRGPRRCWEPLPFKKLASILVHEEWHIRNGSDERGAYEAQLTALLMLGFRQDSAVYHGVVRSMLKVLDAQDRVRRAEAVLVSHDLR
jgi:hypothetical protein